MEQSDCKAAWYFIFHKLILLLPEIGHFLEVALLEDERLVAIGVKLVNLLKVILAVVELVIVHPSKASYLLFVI